VDVVGRGEPKIAWLVRELTRRYAVRPRERTRERFNRVVAGLEAGFGHAGLAAGEPPGSALEQEAASKRSRRLADAGAHQAVEVEWAQHRACCECRPVEALVEGFEYGVDDVAQAVGAHRLHAAEHACAAAGAHDRDCCRMARSRRGGVSRGNDMQRPAMAATLVV